MMYKPCYYLVCGKETFEKMSLLYKLSCANDKDT